MGMNPNPEDQLTNAVWKPRIDWFIIRVRSCPYAVQLSFPGLNPEANYEIFSRPAHQPETDVDHHAGQFPGSSPGLRRVRHPRAHDLSADLASGHDHAGEGHQHGDLLRRVRRRRRGDGAIARGAA